MEIRQLEYFLAVAKYSSLTKAADALYTTQPHVSMVIRSLEKELGVPLFKRRSKGMELTEEGIRIYAYAENVLKNTNTIRQISRDTNKVWLKVASNPSSYMASLFTAYYDRLQEEHITLQYTECGIEEMMNRMSQEQYDLGFVFAPIDRQFALKQMADRRKLEYVELFRSELVVHVAPTHPLYGKKSVSRDELAELSFIQLDEDYFTIEDLLNTSDKNGTTAKELHRVVSTNSDHMMIQMLKRGKVCNLGSYWLADKFREYDFSMIPVEGYQDTVSFGYLKHRRHPLKKPARDFMDYLVSEVINDRMI